MGATQSISKSQQLSVKDVNNLLKSTDKLTPNHIQSLMPNIKVYPGPGIASSLANSYRQNGKLTGSEEKEMQSSYTLRLCGTSTYMSLAPSIIKLYIIQNKKAYKLTIPKKLGKELFIKCTDVMNTSKQCP